MIAVALVGVAFTAFLQVLSATIVGADTSHQRTLLVDLARSQTESIQNQTFQTPPASYTVVSAVPAGYSISIDTGTARSYTYSGGSAAPLTSQVITVTVTGPTESFQTSFYRTNR